MDWAMTPGTYDVPYVMPGPLGPCPKVASSCYSFVAETNSKCLEHLNPYVLQDGRRIYGMVSKETVPGGTGVTMTWTFMVEWGRVHPGPFVFHVETQSKWSADCEPIS